jgi:REP element-mobilizing transposase RayT
MALAYFITFTTYGTRLHGDAKGSVDEAHNAYDTPVLSADEEREKRERAAMTQSPYVMEPVEREVVCKAIVGLAAERGWNLLAAHVRSTHVHVVIVTEERDPGRTMSDLKARASRALNLAGFDSAERKRWARHGSTRHLFRDEEVEEKVHYTLDEQGERMAWYARHERAPWERRTPLKEPRT